MRILFVCTGNISRSAMAELLAPHIFKDDSLTFESAGARGLHDHPISEEAAELLRRDGIDGALIDAFRSRRVSPQVTAGADLILCFETAQRSDIVVESPLKARRTFLITDFANMCETAKAQGWLTGSTIEERIDSVVDNAGLLRPELPDAENVDDPQGRGMDAFVTAHNALVRVLKHIATALE
ncbi:low molecular weight phosphatase family protein [Bifidobacterium sp. MA2]|uniref:Low molecular weight phosphatase family protein n=1 Tax=Bifidobacterium santillanense TaxID=2809028 RepID=A0ABS5UQH0_9BIFI|nr:low molecular weight phosphatase family protein [Bifidobacterium santillanense]MBT1173147.1 low molecular weight phosphatase family protein [Bifidobacterium santillanense]